MLEIMKYPSRIIKEAEIVSMRFGEVDFNDDWVLVHTFNLPHGYNCLESRLLIELPQNFPELPPNKFYLDRGLRFSNGRIPGHYYEDRYVTEELKSLGFAWFCLHIKDWKANFQDMFSGSTLLKSTDAVYKAMESEVIL